MPDKNLKDTLQRELELLGKARDELKVQMHLAKAEAREEWTRLEGTWQRVQDELKRVGEHAKEPAREMGGAARSLLDELKRGYARVKSQLK
jgi:phage-related minor tail protein